MTENDIFVYNKLLIFVLQHKGQFKGYRKLNFLVKYYKAVYNILPYKNLILNKILLK